MGFCKEYGGLSEKYQYVERVPFDGSFDGLLAVLGELANKGFEFRGQANALWAVVPSARRAYVDCVEKRGLPISGCSFVEFCAKALEWLKRESDCVPRPSAGNSRSELYDHEVWGWAQHYGYKTPLVDFTHDYNVALYMAIKDYWEKPAPDGFFSIYALNGNCEAKGNELTRLEVWLERERETLELCGADDRERFAFEAWKNFPGITIHKDRSLQPWDEHVAKERIASQSGMFVYSNSAEFPLERYLAQQSAMADGEDGDGCELQKLRCIDVPWRMLAQVRKHCEDNNCTGEGLGFGDQRLDRYLDGLWKRFEEEILRGVHS